MDEQELFDNLAAEMGSDAANELLDKMVGTTRQWVALERAKGEKPTIHELARKLSREQRSRGATYAALSAALWRLAEEHRAPTGQ